MERLEMNGMLERLLGLEGLCVNGASLERDGLVVHVRVRLPAPRCGICNDFQPPYGWQPVRRWRHLTLERTPVWLSYAPRRANCATHRVRVQRVPWAAHAARFTTEFEQMLPWLCRRIGLHDTCRMMRIPWSTAERLQSFVVRPMPDLKRIEERYVLGADVLSLRSHAQDLAAVLEQLGRPQPAVIALPALPASAC
jgi:transposase